jgi:hypothetical protein
MSWGKPVRTRFIKASTSLDGKARVEESALTPIDSRKLRIVRKFAMLM